MARNTLLSAMDLGFADGVITVVNAAAMNTMYERMQEPVRVDVDERDAMYKSAKDYIANCAEYWTAERIANICENMHDLLSQIANGGINDGE